MGKTDNTVNAEFVATPNFCGPAIKRNSTDVICLLLILLSWAVMTCKCDECAEDVLSVPLIDLIGIGFAALGIIKSDYINKGDPNRLVRGGRRLLQYFFHSHEYYSRLQRSHLWCG